MPSSVELRRPPAGPPKRPKAAPGEALRGSPAIFADREWNGNSFSCQNKGLEDVAHRVSPRLNGRLRRATPSASFKHKLQSFATMYPLRSIYLALAWTCW